MSIGSPPYQAPFMFCSQKADQAVNNSTTLVDSGITFSVNASTTYGAFILLFEDGDAAADLKVQFTYPAGTTGAWGSSTTQALTSDFSLPAGGVGTEKVHYMFAEIVTGVTAGSLTLQFAQNVAQANDMTLHAGSYIVLWEAA